MKYQLLLLLLISLSGCSSSMLKDEKTSQKIELTKELEDDFITIDDDTKAFRKALMESTIERIKEEKQMWIDFRPSGCCSNIVPSNYFYKNKDEVLEVLKQRCGIGVSPNVLDPEKIMKVKKDLLKGWKRSVSNLINVEVGKCSSIRLGIRSNKTSRRKAKINVILKEERLKSEWKKE